MKFMKRYMAAIIAPSLLAVAPLAGCGNTPPPVTGFDSFVEDLRYAGASVNTTYIEDDPELFAESYVSLHYFAFEQAQSGGRRVIEPEFLDAENGRLNVIRAWADSIVTTRTEIEINGATVRVREYENEESAATDAAYLPLVMDFDITIPTDKGDAYFTPSTLGLTFCTYKKGRIIVEYIAEYEPSSEDKSIMGLLESILGPPVFAGN